MPINFNGSSDKIQTDIGGHIAGMQWGTIAAVLKITNLQWGNVWEAVSGTDAFSLEISDTSQFVYNSTGTPSQVNGGPTVANGWCFILAAKDTGTVAPKFWKYIYNTGTWSNPTGGSTLANFGGTIGNTYIGVYENSADFCAMDLAAVAVWKHRALPDGEVRRLAAGNWQEFSPSLHMEWPGGYNPVVPAKDLTNGGLRETARSGMSRTASYGPPGFRYSIKSRRR